MKVLSNTATVTSDVADVDLANNQATVTLAIGGNGYGLLLPGVLKKHY